MDTVPFHLILLALDIVVLGGLFLWMRFRPKYSYTWDMLGVLLFGCFGLVCFAGFCRLIFTDYVQQHVYHFNVGQCIVEGIAFHWTFFGAGTATLLCQNRRYLPAVFFAGGTLLLAGICFNAMYWEPYHLKVEYYRIETEKVEAPLRIVFVSDIQTDRISSHEINTLKTIHRLEADLIILGGDYIQSFGARERRLPEKFRQTLLDYPLTAPLGVYAIGGNISDSNVRDAELFKETGIAYFQDTVLFDHLGVEEGRGPIDLVLLSHGDSWGNVGERGLTDSGNYIVMAGHCPNYAVDGYTNPNTGNSLSGYRNAKRAPDLMLAGHTHGGQVVIPFYGVLAGAGDERVEQIPRNMRSGMFTYPNGSRLLITRGSGMERGWAPRIRLFCPAEISVIDIVRKE